MNEWRILFCFGSKPGRPGSMKRRSFVQGKQCTKEPQFQFISIAYCIAFSLFYSLTYRGLDCYLWNSDLHCLSLRNRHGWILFLLCLWHWAGPPVYYSRNLYYLAWYFHGNHKMQRCHPERYVLGPNVEISIFPVFLSYRIFVEAHSYGNTLPKVFK